MTAPAKAGPRVRFLDHGPLRVILLDFEGIMDVAEALAAVAEARAFVGRQTPDGSHYTLTDVRRTRYDRQIVAAFKELTTHNKPFIRAAAIVSDSTVHRAAITMIAAFSRRKLAVFATREEGLAYLQKEHATRG